jgi:thiol-disulfide isomerase/thioredoxin
LRAAWVVYDRRGFFAAAGSALVVMGGVCSDAGASGARPGSWCIGKGGSPFEFQLYELTDDGSKIVFDLESLSGFPVWMMFFTSWCPPCNSEAPAIVSMADAYRAQGVKVIGIDVKEKPEPVRDFVKKHGIDFPIVMDTTGSVFKDLGGAEYPSHVFLDRDGYVTCVAVGMLERKQMDNEIAVAMAVPLRKKKI